MSTYSKFKTSLKISAIKFNFDKAHFLRHALTGSSKNYRNGVLKGSPSYFFSSFQLSLFLTDTTARHSRTEIASFVKFKAILKRY